MLDRMLASDPAYDGRFVVGVTTTGVYCLPSCRARKPKPDNVRFFPTVEQAREVGLRPCKRCRPDDFYRRHDPDLERIERAVAQVRESPADFADVAAMARLSALGTSKLHELARRHFHATPGQLLTRARIAKAQGLLLANGSSVAGIAFEVGYEGLSSFNERFRRLAALPPADYRKLLGGRDFTLALPSSYPLDQVLGHLGRDPSSPTCRVAGREASLALSLAGAPALVRLRFGSGAVRCALESSAKLPDDAAVQAHGQLLRVLGLDRSPEAFERACAASPDGARLIAGRKGLRLLGTPDPFDGLVWSIVGQQVNLPFAFTLRRRLIERSGVPVADGLACLPAPAALAELSVDDLTRDQFSRRKAEYLIGAARLVATGALPLGALARGSATRAQEALLAVRGLGPWSAHYLLLRGFGHEDCVPLGDSGLTRGLMTFYGLAERPGERETAELMAPFAPYRSWATLHLWQSLRIES